MYLNLLKDNEKELFLEMAYYLAAADGNYSDSEKLMMKEYCKEMQVEILHGTIKRTVEEILDEINNKSDEKAKRIFIFELVGLTLVDGCYDESEKEFINKIANKFSVNGQLTGKIEKTLREYIMLQDEMNKLIL